MRTLLSSILLLIPFQFYAQETKEEPEKFSGSLIASYSIPTGEFKSVYGKGAIGANLSLMYSPEPKLPLSVGVEVAYHYMDGDSYRYSGGTTSYEKTATSNFVSVFPKLRIQYPGNLAVNPFAEALVGANFFYSREKVVSYSSWEGEYKDKKLRGLNIKPGFGFAAGLNIPLSKSGERLELKTMYLLSGKTNYYGNPTYSGNGDLNFTAMRSRTDMLMFQVGINL